jgi:hypothetical protein
MKLFADSCLALSLTVALVAVLLLTGCGVGARADVRTDLRLLGGGHHDLLVTVPVELYRGELFDRLPNLSLLTGVDVQDYREDGRQGLRITQRFSRLGELIDDPENALVLNKLLPGTPVTYQAAWDKGLFGRRLTLQISIAPPAASSLLSGIEDLSLTGLHATYTLHMPGRIVNHDGVLQDERSVTWDIDLRQPRTLAVTAEVVSLPTILGVVAVLALACVLTVWLILRRGDSSGRANARRPTLGRRSSAPQTPTRQSPPRPRL